MGPWSTGSEGISKDEAQSLIIKMAKEKGIKGAFKVYYDGELVANVDDLPDDGVVMSKVSVSAIADQA